MAWIPAMICALAILTGGVTLAGVVGIRRLGARASPAIAAILVIGILWIWSIGQTAGGWTYSARVLTPAVAVGAVLAGWVGSLSRRWQLALALLALPLATDAARRAWHLPEDPFLAPFSTSFREWRQMRAALRSEPLGPVWDTLIANAAGRGIIVDHPLYHVQIRRRGGHPVSWFSPETACLFDTQRSFAEVVAELRRRNIRYIALVPRVPVNDTFMAQQPHLRTLLAMQPHAGAGILTVFDLEQLPVSRNAPNR